MFPKGTEGDCGQGAAPGSTPGGSTCTPHPPLSRGYHEACQHQKLGETRQPSGLWGPTLCSAPLRGITEGPGRLAGLRSSSPIISPSSSSIPELSISKSLIQLRLRGLQSPLSSSAWRTNLGHLLWLLGSCCDILTPSLSPDHPLIRSELRPTLWTHSLWGVL